MKFARLDGGRDSDCLRDALVISVRCVVIRKSKSPLWAEKEIVRNGPAKRVGSGCLGGWLVSKFLACSCWSGMNEAAVFHLEVGTRAGLAEKLPCSALKIAMGSELRGRGGGSFGSWVGPHPLPLPARPFVRKCPRVRGFRCGRVPEHQPSHRRGGLEARRGERTGQQPQSPGRRSQMAGCLLPAASAGRLQAL